MLGPTTGEDGSHPTYCRLCEAQCGLIAEVRDGVITRVGPDRDHPVSRGHLCVKAPGMLRVMYDRDRLLQPMKRSGAPGRFKPVSWEAALDDLAHRLDRLTRRHGGNALAGYFGNPAAFSSFHYTYGAAFLRMLGSDRLYNAMQVDTGARVLASDQVFGDSGRYPFPDLPDTEFLLILGGNPLISHMSLVTTPRARELLDGIARRGSVVVVDPRETETARRYDHQPIKPGGDVYLLLGLLKCLVEESLTDEDFLASRVNGWMELKHSIVAFRWSAICSVAGIDEERIRDIARDFSRAAAAACYGRVGTNRGRFSTLANVLMDALNLATGNFGKSGGSVIGRNPFEPEQGPRRAATYGERRSRVGDLPLVANTQPGGGLAAEILTPGKGQIRALFLDSGNPVLSYPRGDLLAEALETLELFVSLDLYMTESNRYADYILPVPTFYERADVNDQWAANAPEPWVQYVDPVVPPMGNCRHEYDIYDDILERLGLPELASEVLGDIPDASARRTCLDIAENRLRAGAYGDKFGGNPAGLNLDRLREEHPSGCAVRERVDAYGSWQQVNFADHKPRLWTEMIRSELDRLARDPLDDGGLRLCGRRLLHTMNSWMHNSEKVIRNARATLLMHPEDAQVRQIKDGQKALLHNRHGELEVIVEVTETVVPGSVNYPHGFGHRDGGWQEANAMPGENVNLLASAESDDWEPVSGNCHLDGIPVDVRPL